MGGGRTDSPAAVEAGMVAVAQRDATDGAFGEGELGGAGLVSPMYLETPLENTRPSTGGFVNPPL